MMSIVMETRFLIEAALAGDPALASLAVTGSTPETLSADIAPGVPARWIGGCSYSPHPPFSRETIKEQKDFRQRDIYVPDLHIDSIRVRGRNFH